jgi:hypothetical protein
MAALARGYRSLIAVPIMVEDDLIGVVVLVRREPQPFTDEHIALVQTFADQAAIAVANARLIEAVERHRTELARFVFPQVAELLSSRDGEQLLAGHRAYISCLFSDLYFTSADGGPNVVLLDHAWPRRTTRFTETRSGQLRRKSNAELTHAREVDLNSRRAGEPSVLHSEDVDLVHVIESIVGCSDPEPVGPMGAGALEVSHHLVVLGDEIDDLHFEIGK